MNKYVKTTLFFWLGFMAALFLVFALNSEFILGNAVSGMKVLEMLSVVGNAILSLAPSPSVHPYFVVCAWLYWTGASVWGIQKIINLISWTLDWVEHSVFY